MTDLTVYDRAHNIYERLLELRDIEANTKVEASMLLKVVRDNELYKTLGYDSFKDFIASPELSMSYRTVRGNISMLERFLDAGHKVSTVVQIGPKKGMMVAPYIGANPELVDMALSLSSSDLLTEVHRVAGKVSLRLASPGAEPAPDCTTYKDYCKQGCCLCGGQNLHMHHFPHTRRVTDNQKKVIPLCGECHQEFHDTPWTEWCGKYGRKVYDYLLNFILRNK